MRIITKKKEMEIKVQELRLEVIALGRRVRELEEANG